MTDEYDFSAYDFEEHNVPFANMTPLEILQKKKELEEFNKQKEAAKALKREEVVPEEKAASGAKPKVGAAKPAFKPRVPGAKPKVVGKPQIPAKKEGEEFSKVFSRGKLPEQMPAFSLSSFNLEKASLLNVLASTEKFGSRGEIRRLVKQGAIKLDNVRVDDPEMEFHLEPNQKDVVIKAGKKIFIRIEK